MEIWVLMITLPPSISLVPFHSQIREIASRTWELQGCGITSLAMIVDYYRPGVVSVQTLLGRGIAAGAFIENAGWSHQGLIDLSKKYALTGSDHDLSASTGTAALATLATTLKTGPVIASVHYKLDPKNPLPHMIVVDGIDNGTVYYNDPDGKAGEQKIASADFLKAWKKRYIVIRPTDATIAVAPRSLSDS